MRWASPVMWRSACASSMRAGSWRKGRPTGSSRSRNKRNPAGSWIGSSPPAGCSRTVAVWPRMSEARPRLGAVPPFRVESEFAPAGDQPAAVDQLTTAVRAGEQHITLLGATGTGKTFTIAHVIERVQRPTIVMAPNKSLAAQLANEFRGFFPDNAVEYFVSYYDYYQPEAYVPQTDTYIEKDSSVNEEIERLRHSATAALLSRDDVIVVATVSCIYGLGTPQEYVDRMVELHVGQEIDRDSLLRRF